MLVLRKSEQKERDSSRQSMVQTVITPVKGLRQHIFGLGKFRIVFHIAIHKFFGSPGTGHPSGNVPNTRPRRVPPGWPCDGLVVVASRGVGCGCQRAPSPVPPGTTNCGATVFSAVAGSIVHTTNAEAATRFRMRMMKRMIGLWDTCILIPVQFIDTIEKFLVQQLHEER